MGNPYRKIVALAHVNLPCDDLRDEDVRRAMRDTPGASAVAAHMVRIWTDIIRREFLQAFVVAGCSSEVVDRLLDVPVPVYKLFCVYGFDMDEFDDRTDLCAWVARYEPDSVQGRTRPGKELLEMAMIGGEELLRARFDPSYVVPAERVARVAMTDAFARGRAVRARDGKKASHVATTSLKLALEASKTLKDSDPDNDLGVLLFKLRARRDDTPMKSIEGTVLH